MTLKACLHLQFLLRFLVRFSPSDACERVGEFPHLNSHNSSTRSHASEEEIALEIAAKIASVNMPLQRVFLP